MDVKPLYTPPYERAYARPDAVTAFAAPAKPSWRPVFRACAGCHAVRRVVASVFRAGRK